MSLPTERYLKQWIQEDLDDRKAVFLGGPRQVGKTTFARHLLGIQADEHPAYLNWDELKVRNELMRGNLPSGQDKILLDEIHKYARWRNLVKGFYDTRKNSTQFIVTGSARLDYYRKGGDSLQGRYHYYRLHPFSLREINSDCRSEDLKRLLKFGGFPEPFLRGSERHWRRWQRERLSRIIREDLRDLERVKEITLIEMLAGLLPDKVGAPISIKSLREDLQVSHESVERWITILERLYYCFRIAPYGAPKVRAVKKEQKLYLWDWSLSPEGGYRFENLVASQLLKYCHWMEDVEGYDMELRYFRDIDLRELDFVVLKEKKPIFAVECKTGEKARNPVAFYLRERTPVRQIYQVHLGEKDFGDADTDVRVLPFTTFCKMLELP